MSSPVGMLVCTVACMCAWIAPIQLVLEAFFSSTVGPVCHAMVIHDSTKEVD